MTATQQETPERHDSRCRNMLQLASSRSNCGESIAANPTHLSANSLRASQSDLRESVISRDPNMGAALSMSIYQSQTEEMSVEVVPQTEVMVNADDTAPISDSGSSQITFLPRRESPCLTVQVSDVPGSHSSTDEGSDAISGLPDEQQSCDVVFDSVVVMNDSQNEACGAETTQVLVPNTQLLTSSLSGATEEVSLEQNAATDQSTTSLHAGVVSVSLDVERGNAAQVAASSPPSSRISRQLLDPQAASARWAGKLSPLMYAPPPYVAEPPPYAAGADRRTPTTISELYRAAPLAFEMPPPYDSTGSSQQRSPRGRGTTRNRSRERSERRATSSKCSAPRCGCWMLIIFAAIAFVEIITSVSSP